MAPPFVLRDFYAVIYSISLNFKHKNPWRAWFPPEVSPVRERLKQGDYNAGAQALLNDSQKVGEIKEERKGKQQKEKYSREVEQWTEVRHQPALRHRSLLEQDWHIRPPSSLEFHIFANSQNWEWINTCEQKHRQNSIYNYTSKQWKKQEQLL